MKKTVKKVLNSYYQLTKMGIVFFALLTAILAYFLSLDDLNISFKSFGLFVIGFYFATSGSFILNQAQEWRLDKKMKRTRNRPIPSGQLSPFQAYILSFLFLLFGLAVLFLLKPLTAFLLFLTVVLYNGCYTILWKKYLRYGAVLGALPGALPPVIGYSLGEYSIFSTACIYLFLLLFFWQMPHFWSLAIYYREDYKRAGLPVLPALENKDKTLYQIGCYMLAYIGMTLISPLFLTSGLMYVLVLLPLAFILLYQFFIYTAKPSSHWLKFFLWINASIVIYFSTPVVDKWIFHYLAHL